MPIKNLHTPHDAITPNKIFKQEVQGRMKNRIKVYRALHELTQEALADKLAVTRQTILAIEKGKYDPSLDLAFRISELFGIPIEKIFLRSSGGEDNPQFED